MRSDPFNIKIGSRASRLAVLQVEEVCSLLQKHRAGLSFERVTYATEGDKDKQTSLTDSAVKDDFFTDTLDTALLKGEIDLAVHSAKDLPKVLREGLSLFALTASLDETDCFVGRVAFKNLPSGAKIGTSSLIRQESIRALKPDARIVDIRGTIEERLQLIEKGVCDGLIVATVALKRLGLEKHIKDIMPWDAAPLQGQLAVVGRSEDSALRSMLVPLDVRRQYGRVTLVGAGPGDPDLITVKGVEALKRADCIFYDYLTSKELLHYAPQAEKIDAGKRKGEQTLSQAELSRSIRHKAQAGKNVVRLKGGDPLIFGRGAEEIEYLRAYHIPVRVIPGVSSATAIPSSLGIPLTARGLSSSVAFISGHGQGERGSVPEPIEIPQADTIVFLMGLTKLGIILETLKKEGWRDETPIVVVSKGTCPDEKIIAGELKNIADKVARENPGQPALIIVGPTMKFWDGRHYGSNRILYTGTNPDKYKALGDIVHLPMIQLAPASIAPAKVDELVQRLERYHMILFTSRAAVKYFLELLQARGFDAGRLKGKDIVAIGRDTARALNGFGLQPALVSPVETSEGMLDTILDKFDVKGKSILFPRSSLPNPYLKDGLERQGARVDVLTVYQNTPLPKRELPTVGVEKILFTSPSTVLNFLKDYGTIPRTWMVLSKGPRTSQCLREAGYESEVLSDD